MSDPMAFARSAHGGWRSAYLLAIANAATFLTLTFIGGAIHVGVGIQALIAVTFGVGSVLSFISLLRNGGALAAVSYYILGTGLLLGFGTAYSTVADDWVFKRYFSASIQEEILPTINLVNSISVLFALLAAWPFVATPPDRDGGQQSLREVLSSVGKLQTPLLMISIPYIALLFLTFPLPEDLILRTALTNFQSVAYFSLVLCGLNWSNSDSINKFMATTIVFLLAIFGLIGLSKTRMLLPIAAFCAGLLLDRASRRLLIGIAAVLTVSYFFALAPICDNGRNDAAYDSFKNTIGERVDIVSRTWTTLLERSDNRVKRTRPLLTRFAAAPEQAYLIKAYENGAHGSSMADAWTALIPRVLWPDKPNITRFGTEFDSLFFRRSHSESALAPTYTGEAFWNYGWVGLIGVSILVGLEIGWFTRKWILFTRGARGNIGILIFTVPVILFSVWVETWVVANYVGGFVTLVVLITGTDLIPWLFGSATSDRNQALPDPANRGPA